MKATCLWHKFKDVKYAHDKKVLLQKCMTQNCSARRVVILDRSIKVDDLLWEELGDQWKSAKIVRA